MVKKKAGATSIAQSPLKLLILEDNPNDAKLTTKGLERGGIAVDPQVTDSQEVYRELLANAEFDIILADYYLPGWTAIDALDILQESGKDIPFIVMTGSLLDEDAAECIKRGATDFILKDRPARLPAAIQRAREAKRLNHEKKRAEAALLEERHLLLTLMDRLPDLIYFKDRESRFTRINTALARQFGLSDPAVAVGRSDRDFYASEHAEAAYDDEQRIIQTGEPLIGKEEQEVWPDGRVSWVSTTKMPLRDTLGNITGTFGVSRDITEKKLAEVSLRESEEFFRATFEDAGVGMALVDIEGRLIKSNPTLQRMLGFGEEELSHRAFTEITHPEDRELDWGFYRELTEGKRQRYEIEKRYLKKSGEVLWGLLTISLAKGQDGRPICAVGMVQDITERKLAEAALRQSEQQYRDLFERNLAGVFVTTWDGRILDCNQAMADIMGFASPQAALSVSVPHLWVSADDRAQFLARLESAGRLNNYEMELRRKDGSAVWLIGNISLGPQTTTGLRIIEGTLIDITERKLAEAENTRLAQIVNSSEDAIFSTTHDGIIATWNAGAERMFGYASNEIVAKHYSSLVPVASRAEVSGNRAKLFLGEAFLHYENQGVRKDGSIFPVLLTLSPLKDPNGAVSGVSIIGRDITERKRAEEVLRDREEKYRSLVSNIPDVVWTLDASFHFVFISKNIETVSGFSVEEINQHGPDLYLSSLHPEDVSKVKEGLIALFSEGRPYDVECRVRRKDGEWIWVHDRAVGTYEKNGIRHADGLLSDITEHKRAEEELRFKTAVLEAQSETTLDGILVVDKADRVLMMNRRFVEMWNLPENAGSIVDDQKMIPMVVQQLRNPEAFLARVRYLNAHMEEKSSDELEFKDGRFFDRYSSPLRGPQGQIYGRIWYFRDISERKRAEEALRASEECLAAGERLTHTGSWRWNLKSGELFWSKETYRIFGFDPAQGKASIRETFLPRIHPEDRAAVAMGLRNPTEPDAKEYRVVLADGSIRHIHDIAYPVLDAGGNAIERFGVACDVTERKRSEAERVRLATAIEQSAEAVVITNLRGEIEYVNPAFTRITGYSPEEVLGQNPRILKSNRQDPVFYQQLWDTILAGKNWHGELINQRKDGTQYTEQMSITPVKGPHGEVTHFIATIMDVSERKNLEEQLQRAAKMEAVGRLAGGVAHDFNNLLTVINGYAEILKGRLASDQKASEYLQEIGAAGERAAGLTRQLLAFSRRQVLAPQVLDLNTVVSNLEKMLRRLIGEDVKLRTKLDPTLGRVKADPGQIEQVLMNLAVNSRDAMPFGGDLTIETSNVDLDAAYAANHPTVKPGPHVMLAVSDSGMGMPPEIKTHIFEPFFTTKEHGKGTGLGLATVYGIVKQSEGSIWLYSELGQGTVFKIYLPIVDEVATEVAPPSAVVDSASGTETILLIEDEDGVRSLVQVALASGGYTVLVSEDAQGGLALCAGHSGPIHLLLTDVVMPQMSGPAVAEKIAAVRPGVKVLFMSGYTDDAIVHHGVLSQGTPFIQKPFSPVALRRKIREVLGKPPKEDSTI